MEKSNDMAVSDDPSGNEIISLPSNTLNNYDHKDGNAPPVLRRGDLVRVSELGKQNMKSLRDRAESLGRVVEVDDKNATGEPLFTVEWIVHGGKSSRIRRDFLIHTTASAEGMIDNDSSRRNSRKRRKPESYEENAKKLDEDKKRKKLAAKETGRSITQVKPARAVVKQTKVRSAKTKLKAVETTQKTKRPSKTIDSKRGKAEKGTESTKHSNTKEKTGTKAKEKTGTKAKQDMQETSSKENASEPLHALNLYEKHRREFERLLDRLENKVDKYRCFSDEDPDSEAVATEHGNTLESSNPILKTESLPSHDNLLPSDQNSQENVVTKDEASIKNTSSFAGESISAPFAGDIKSSSYFPTSEMKIDPPNDVSTSQTNAKESPPLNWKMIRRRMELGTYVLNREKLEEDRRFLEMEDYYKSLDNKPRRRYFSDEKQPRKKFRQPNPRVLHPLGVYWDRFRDDVLAMCDAGIAQETEDPNQPYSITSAANKIKEHMLQAYERTGRKQMQEMTMADGVHKYLTAIERSENSEAAMQSHREGPFPERIYERLSADTVCDGLSKVDEEIAIYERQTSLKDSFVGLAYRYDDTGQSEAWMKSVVDETAANGNSRDKVRQAALALSADDGVTRAQVIATMQSLLIGVQDKVLTERRVLSQPEIRSVNWEVRKETAAMNDEDAKEESKAISTETPPEIVEQPVWGIDCYTRRNITVCLQTEFDPRTSILFIEKWLLPAINACPVELAQDISNAAKLLEGVPLSEESETSSETDTTQNANDQQTILGAALRRKIEATSPSWLKAAASELRRARSCLGPNFFRVHPKGHGSVLLSQKVDANRLVTFYRGELYPSWRWGEKMDAIAMTQDRKNLKPALPDFYNMALERPQSDPRGYGLLFVDASRKAGYGSSLSHSCDPTCEVRVAAKDGELCLAMTTLRELEMGEELTFDYHAVTESLNEYKSAVCLCGYGKCRGSFLHFATADCYQQVLNRNAPIATRFSNLVKGSTKQVMSEDDIRVLRNHGFNTAAFGAISVNRREESSFRGKSSLVGSMDLVPVWLKTYVADTLRYIEYERRALPISLICDHLSTVRQEQTPDAAISQMSKPPGREPAFFYFSRVEHNFLLSSLKKDPLYQSLNDLELKHAVKKFASNYWQNMSEDQKDHWKKRANIEYEKKKKAWLLSENHRKRDEPPNQQKQRKSKKGSNSIPDIRDVLLSSKISFEDADAEGVSAMEQRIQQLTQSLNRVGRVLDRHREVVIEACNDSTSTPDLQTLRQMIHAPVCLLSDEGVVSWMWSSENGVVQTLLRHVGQAKCTRPSLGGRLREVREKYVFLADFKAPLDSNSSDCCSSSAKGIEGRLQLKNALLDMRKIILDELKEMAREFRRSRSAAKTLSDNSDELIVLAKDNMGLTVNEDAPSSQRHEPTLYDEIGGGNDHGTNAENKALGHQMTGEVTDTSVPFQETTETDCGHEKCSEKQEKPELNSVQRVVMVPGDRISSEEVQALASPKTGTQCPNAISTGIESGSLTLTTDSEKHAFVPTQENVGASTSNTSYSIINNVKECENPENSLSWISHYDQRVSLQAAADTLLFYAYTSNFFVMKSYKTLESTPVEVYAREIGNSVPLSVVDEGLLGSDSTEERKDKDKSYGSSAEKKQTNKTCLPDDIVASVTVRYEGDYVLSQLLQWYNGGIGQRRGLPDLLGCVMLPSMDGCWTSPVAQRRRKPEKKTPYESKVRPRLIEWFQDPFQRGNAWPDEIRQAFVGENGDLHKFDDSILLPFGSPIVDFLVTGDESNIQDVLELLDAEEKVAARSSPDGLLSSVDRGRPAQAVSTWVQCESAECLKWRKIPWHVDIDLLPEKFYCKDNIWNPLANSCDAPEDEWDANDSLVDANGKVEGSPIRKRKQDHAASPLDERSFVIGARFDVLRQNKEKYEVGVVTKVDFSGKIKRVQFHFPKLSSKFDEWIDFGSERIARLHTNVPKDPRLPKKTKLPTRQLKHPTRQMNSDIDNGLVFTSTAKPRRPSTVDAENIEVGDVFDVYREGAKRANLGVVEQIEFSEESKRILFRFPRTNPQVSEWYDFDKEKIRPYKSRANKDSSIGFSLKTARCPATVDAENIEVGDVFDVYREGATRANLGVVEKIEFSEESKRILFRFPRANPQVSEWYDFDKEKIRPYKSRANKDSSIGFSLKTARCPTTVDADNIEVGDVFDVYREDVKRANLGVVEQVEFSEGSKRILFRFPRANPQVSEWYNYDNEKIRPHKSRANKYSSIDFSLKTARCPTTVDAENIEVGDVFDVYREDVKRANLGVVEQIDFTEGSKRVLFRFPRTNPQVSAWHDLDPVHIRPFKRKSKKIKENQDVKTAAGKTVESDLSERGPDEVTKEKINANGLDLLLTAISGQDSTPHLAIQQNPASSSSESVADRTSVITADITQSLDNLPAEQQSDLSLPSKSPPTNTGNQIASHLNPPHIDSGSQGLAFSVQGIQTAQDTSRLVNFPAYYNYTPYSHNFFDQAPYGYNYIQGNGLNGNPAAQHHLSLSALNGASGFTSQVSVGTTSTGNNGGNPPAAANLQSNQISLSGVQVPHNSTRPNETFPFNLFNWPDQNGSK